ncbi:HAMP domain-containing sensor histidine kinase [Myxococcaceae bacterium GXIMD 01537]
MKGARGRFPRGMSPLMLRIWLVALAQLVLVGFAVDLARAYLVEPPWKKSAERNSAYLVAEWNALRERPEALQASLDRARREMEMGVTLRAADGTLLGTNLPTPTGDFSAAEREQLSRERVAFSESRRMLMVATPSQGPVAAYATLERPPPRPPTANNVLFTSVALACTALISALFARTLVPPLRRLASVARSFGSGELGVRTGLRRKDELGQVAEAFDEMAERLTYLLRSQKELLANVSHELRTPLSRIRVALDLADEGDAQLARESLADIAEDLSELERLVEDVLTTARLDFAAGAAGGGAPPLRLQRVDAQALLERSAARFRAARPQHRLTVDVQGPLPELEADPVLLRRVLDNLLDNAGKYSEPDTSVWLRAKPVEGGMEVEVADEGIGIDAIDLPHLFTPFFRSDRSRARATGGVGLGLALARRIVDAHGGSLQLDSQPGVGTTVRVRLAQHPERGQAGAAPALRHQT